MDAIIDTTIEQEGGETTQETTQEITQETTQEITQQTTQETIGLLSGYQGVDFDTFWIFWGLAIYITAVGVLLIRGVQNIILNNIISKNE